MDGSPALLYAYFMKYIPKLFLETTVFNFYFEGKQGKKQKDTIKLFHDIAQGKYEAYTSEAVMYELRGASGEKFRKMEALAREYIKDIVPPTAEARRLADIYIAKGIIPEKFDDDALHIATATVNSFDFVISLNQGHIVKLKTMIGTGFANLHEGYRQIGLSAPTEVTEYDR
jgi:hypothetical protein